MRKKTHISLANDITRNLNEDFLLLHKKAFIIGNVLPDCVPSFIVRRHNIDSTFEFVKQDMLELLDININTSKFWRKLGCVLHHTSDYFTYPHTTAFYGNFFEHNKYEKDLKIKFKDYIKNDNNQRNFTHHIFNNLDELFVYIEKKQKEYLSKIYHNIHIDCIYILELAYIVINTILFLKDEKGKTQYI